MKICFNKIISFPVHVQRPLVNHLLIMGKQKMDIKPSCFATNFYFIYFLYKTYEFILVRMINNKGK